MVRSALLALAVAVPFAAAQESTSAPATRPSDTPVASAAAPAGQRQERGDRHQGQGPQRMHGFSVGGP